MPTGLKRHYGRHHLHFITCSCYRRLPLFGTSRRRDVFLRILERVRQRFRFVVVGYVVMPEHIHLLISEPITGDTFDRLASPQADGRTSTAAASARRTQAELFDDAAPPQFWQRRFYDFNVFTERKRIEKLRYMHRNPVKRGLVAAPEEWRWSSYRSYYYGERGAVALNAAFEVPAPTLRSA